MKCPFCGKEMLCGGTICRYDPDCPIYDKPVPIEILELLSHTRKALDVAVDALKRIDETRSVANHKIGTQDKTLNSGVVFCWTTPDEIHNALEQITAEQKEEK